jgi:hypothetical protein
MTCLATVTKVPQESLSIQAAITASHDGDTILVSPGTYYGNIDFLLKNITVASLLLLTGDKQYIDQTIILGDSITTNSAVTINGGQSSATILSGFTIKGGYGKVIGAAQFGGGIFISRSSPIIRSNRIALNRVHPVCSARGGGIAIKDTANPSIFGNTILANSTLWLCDCGCHFGGGIWIDASSNPVIGGSAPNANNIYGNAADYGLEIYRDGGGPIVNAQYNYWGTGIPDSFAIFPFGQFDVSNRLSAPATVRISDPPTLSGQFYLHQNFPNPFNPNTTFRFYLGSSEYISLDVFDLVGKHVASLLSGYLGAGPHELTWNAHDLPSGLYYYRFESAMHSETKKLLLIK